MLSELWDALGEVIVYLGGFFLFACAMKLVLG